MEDAPLAGLRFSLLGPGRVGSSLARWAVARGARLMAVAGRSPGRATALAAALGGVACAADELASEGQDLLLVAVPDAALDAAAELLAARHQATVVLHTCGSRGASALTALAKHRPGGSETGSLHPLQAFPAPLETPPATLVLAIDGTPAARAVGSALAAAWGAETVVVPEELRAVYHLAAVLSAGGLVTLLSLAAELATRAGLGEAVLRGYAGLARGAVAAASRCRDPADALTGPWERGDVATFEAHLEALARLSPERAPLVAQLAREALRQKARRRAAPEGDALREALARRGVP